jgi:hypothetical protein
MPEQGHPGSKKRSLRDTRRISTDQTDTPGMVIALLVGLAVVAVASYFVYTGGKELLTVYHILTNDPLPVGQLHGHRGPAEIEGKAVAEADTGTVTAPFTGSECLAYTYEVEELRSSGKNSSWHTLDEGQGGVDFIVEDETGRVRVNPQGADIRPEAHTIRVSPGDELPGRIESYLASSDDVDKQDGTLDLMVTELSVGNKQRFTERRLDVGESVYVYGQAFRDDRAAEWGSNLVDAVVKRGDATPVFVVSDTDERTTAWRFGRKGLGYVALGVVLLLVALFFTLPAF